MLSAIDENTPLSFLTVGDLRKLLAEALKPQQPRYIKGIAGLMELFKCSKSQAMRIKSSGVIDSAIKQQVAGGAFIVDADMAVTLYDRSKRVIENRNLRINN